MKMYIYIDFFVFASLLFACILVKSITEQFFKEKLINHRTMLDNWAENFMKVTHCLLHTNKQLVCKIRIVHIYQKQIGLWLNNIN